MILLLALCSRLSPSDIAVAILSGYECVSTRVLAAAETWISQFPDVFVYADKFPKDAMDKISAAARSTRVHCIPLGNCARHLWFANAWQRAQPRILKAMHDLFTRAPDKQWYLFLDDDSYVLTENLLAILDRLSKPEPHVVGHFYCAWERLADLPDGDCLQFPQGGAGIAINRHFFANMSDKLLECNEKFNSRLFAGSMRLGACAFEHMGAAWSHKRVIQHFPGQFLSQSPLTEIENHRTISQAATFHNLSPRDLHFVHRGHISEYTDPNGTTMLVDWSQFTGHPYPIYIAENQPLNLCFGYAITLPNTDQVVATATSAITPVFQNTSLLWFKQAFGESIVVNFVCDSRATSLTHQSLRNRIRLDFTARVRCPVCREHHVIVRQPAPVR